MENKKKLTIANNWDESVTELRAHGMAHVRTGGHELWNKQVETILTEKSGLPVRLLSVTQGYKEFDGIYTFITKANNNKQASGLLSAEEDV